MRRRRRPDAGFTLLEILVATVVLAVAIGGVLSALSTSMKNAARLTDYDRAALLARRKMDEILADRRAPKMIPLEGSWGQEFTSGGRAGWRAVITPWERAPDSGVGKTIMERVEVEIWWEDALRRRRAFALEGFRRNILRKEDLPILSGVLP